MFKEQTKKFKKLTENKLKFSQIKKVELYQSFEKLLIYIILMQNHFDAVENN